MTGDYVSGRPPDEIADLPISAHVTVLGADLAVHHRYDEALSRGVRYSTGFSSSLSVRPWDDRLDIRERRYLAAWARRNLFGGAGSEVTES